MGHKCQSILFLFLISIFFLLKKIFNHPLRCDAPVLSADRIKLLIKSSMDAQRQIGSNYRHSKSKNSLSNLKRKQLKKINLMFECAPQCGYTYLLEKFIIQKSGLLHLFKIHGFQNPFPKFYGFRRTHESFRLSCEGVEFFKYKKD